MQARRSRHSTTIFDRTRASIGYTLFSPVTMKPGKVWLIDMYGHIMHAWDLPNKIFAHAMLLPNGNLLCGIEHEYKRPAGEFVIPFANCKMIEMDWDGKLVWEYEDPYMDCHDRVRLPNGNTVIISNIPLPDAYAQKIHKGDTSHNINGQMYTLAIREIDPKGKIVKEVQPYLHADTELDSVDPLCTRYTWPGWNAVSVTAEGDYLVCSYNTFNVSLLDGQTGAVKWRWGKGHISFPHNPTLLPNGNVLLLDNNRFSTSFKSPPDGSRIVEINPKNNEIVWTYAAPNRTDFYTTYMGSCQRLPNNNTLICEASMGRFFEVTPNGEIVWEYVVPFYTMPEGLMDYGPSNATYRCLRYGPDYAGLSGKVFHPERWDAWDRLYGPEGCERDCSSIRP